MNSFLKYLKNTSEKSYLYDENTITVYSRSRVLKHFINIMNKRAKIKLRSQTVLLPMEFSNSYGTFEGLLYSTRDFKKIIRLGWKKRAKNSIDIVDIWLKPGSLSKPDKTIVLEDSSIINIVQLVNQVSKILTGKEIYRESVYNEGIKKNLIKNYLEDFFKDLKIKPEQNDFKTVKILKKYNLWRTNDPDNYPELSFTQIQPLIRDYKNGKIIIGSDIDTSEHIKIVNNIPVKTKTTSENEKLIEELKEEGIYGDLSGEETFELINKYIRGLASGFTKQKLLILAGDPGLGKTEEVEEVLNQVHGKDNWSFEKSKITPLEIYKALYENNGTTLVLDDIDDIFNNTVTINLIKTATDTGKERWLSYRSNVLSLDEEDEFEEEDEKPKKRKPRKKDDIPKKFLYTGTVIIITNLYFKKLPSPLLSRALKVEVDFTPEQSLSRIKSKLEVIYTECPMEIKLKVYDFLSRVKSLFEKLDFRKFFSCCSIYLIEGMDKQGNGNEWIKAQLTDDQEKKAKKYMINTLLKGDGGIRR